MAGAVPDSSSEDSGIISSINITPFVDVVLVLLVIFMVTAPMLVKDILEIKLPKTLSGDGKMLQTLGVAVNKDGNILLNGQITDEDGLREAAKEALGKDPNSQAIISADVEAAYGKVVRVIDILKTNGVERFAVQIEKEEKK
ncbi:MAG: biopolymer transporter ExbD [Bdellovibrionaceae bacterium]|nr:biopolymer transporter ExbD [Pseudobdellovibrionaceae bacterium]